MSLEQNAKPFSVESLSLQRKIQQTESYTSELQHFLDNIVIGQPDASKAVARAVVRHEAGFADPNRPLSTLFFIGPTGVGKTEMAHGLAEYLFHDRERVHIVDCGMLQEKVSYTRLIGAPPGYVGYGDKLLITPDDLVGRNIIVFDEIEKAHPSIYKTLLSVLDRGVLTATVTNGKGEAGQIQLDFRNSYIIFTSNVGAEEMRLTQRPTLGFAPRTSSDSLETAARDALKQHFSQMPEFLGRVRSDEVIVFKQLHDPEYHKIFEKFLFTLNEERRDRDPHASYIAVTPDVEDFIVKLATESKLYGARDIRNTVESVLIPPVQEAVMTGLIQEGEPILATLEEGKIEIYSTPWREIVEPPVDPEDTPLLPPDSDTDLKAPPENPYTFPPYTL